MRRRATSLGLRSRDRWPTSYRPNLIHFNGLNDGLERTGAVPDFSSITVAFGFKPEPHLGDPGERGRIYQIIDQLSPSALDYRQTFRVYWNHVTSRIAVTVWNETAADYDISVGENDTALAGYHHVVVEYSTASGLSFYIDGQADGFFASSFPGPILGSLADESNIGTGQVGIVPRINHYHGTLDDLWVAYNQTPGVAAFWPRRNLGDGNITGTAPQVWFPGKASDWNAGRNKGSQTGWALTTEAEGMTEAYQ